MCDGPDSGLITQTRQQTPEHCLKVGAFAHGSSMSGLVEHTRIIPYPAVEPLKATQTVDW